VLLPHNVCGKNRDQRIFHDRCSLSAPAAFTVYNDPGVFGAGPTEHVHVYVERL